MYSNAVGRIIAVYKQEWRWTESGACIQSSIERMSSSIATRFLLLLADVLVAFAVEIDSHSGHFAQ